MASIDVLLLHISSIKFQYFNLQFWFFVISYSFVKGPPSLVSAICSQRTAVLVYLFYIQRLLSLLPVLFINDCSLCLSLFICKGLLSLSSCYSFVKDCCPCLVPFTCNGLRPCLLLFICKRLRSLSSGIHLQRTSGLVLCYSFAKDCCPCLLPLVCKETAVLIFRFCPSKLRWTVVLAKHGELLSSQGSWKQLFHKLALEAAVSIVSISL